MKRFFNRNKEILVIEKGKTGDTIIITGKNGYGTGYVFTPKELLEFRDYVNERARELIVQGLLQDRLAD